MIKNKVKVKDFIKRTDIKEFQWNLKKEDNDESIRNLANRILKKGFSAPIFIWKNWNKNSILDWHQRIKALNHLKTQKETLQDDKIPVVYIEAETEQEAKDTLLEYNTSYSEFDMMALWEWSEMWDMEFLEIDWLSSENDDEEKDISDNIKNEFQILINCENEIEQEEVFEKIENLWLNIKTKII